MPPGGNGRGNRLDDLNAAWLVGAARKSIDQAPDEAEALIDSVLRAYGLNPTFLTDPFGWRHLTVGSAEAAVGVVEWQPGEHHLVVFAPILDIPEEPAQLWGLFKALLELNHYGTSSARFSLHDGIVYVCLSRSVRGLDEGEVDRAIRNVLGVADSYDGLLHGMLAAVLDIGPLPADEMPNIKMTPKEAQTILNVLRRCDSHGQDIFRFLMERWQKTGYIVDPGTTGIGLKASLGNKVYGLAGIRPGVGERRQLIILGWEGLRGRKIFPPKAVDRYQSVVGRIADLKATKSTAHIEVTEAFDRDSAKALLAAMRALARAARPELAVEEELQWDDSLPSMDVKVGPKTMAGIQAALQACEPRIQEMYANVIESWNQAGGTVQCSRPGRIYLKFQSREHEFGEYGRRSHNFNLAVLAAPKGKQGPSIDVTWNLATGQIAYLDYVPHAVAQFEATVSDLPGFEQVGTITRLVLDEAFEPQHAQTLLHAMLELKAAGAEDD